MTIGHEDELDALKHIGAIVARALRAMLSAIEPGMTTRELDDLGRAALEREDARPAPELCYGFPGATCISIAPEVAHGIPSDRRITAGDLVNVDVSAEKGGFFADTGASTIVPPIATERSRLCHATREALRCGLAAVRPGRRFHAIGKAVERVAKPRGYRVIRNLQSHGVGRSLHEAPGHIPTHYEPLDPRRIENGMVFTVEPFLSTGTDWAEEDGDGWTLSTPPGILTAQFEHSVVATRSGPIILTQAF